MFVHLLRQTGVSIVFLVVLFWLQKYLRFKSPATFFFSSSSSLFIKARFERSELPAASNRTQVNTFFYFFFPEIQCVREARDSGGPRGSPEPAAMPCGSCSQVFFFFSKATALEETAARAETRTRQARWREDSPGSADRAENRRARTEATYRDTN